MMPVLPYIFIVTVLLSAGFGMLVAWWADGTKTGQVFIFGVVVLFGSMFGLGLQDYADTREPYRGCIYGSHP